MALQSSTTRPSITTFNILLLLVAITIHNDMILAHTYLTNPPAYNNHPQHAVCTNPPCKPTCPTLSNSTTPVPTSTWTRGQWVNITWTRNNHHGGLVRLSLVPVHTHTNETIHARLAIFHACWETGMHRCAREEDCGRDRTGRAMASLLVVPDIFPDGAYVFAMAWYGGVERGTARPEERSCARVDVRGGKSGRSYPVQISAGADGRCFTAARDVGECEAGCVRAPFLAVPGGMGWRRQITRVEVEDVIRRGSEMGALGLRGGL